MRVPSLASIVNRALDDRGDAVHAHDTDTIRQIDTLIRNLYRGAKMRWASDGALLVTSVNTIGAVYVVTERTCDCAAFKPCWHMRLFALLVDMLETEAVTADNEADPPIDIPDEPNPTPGGDPAPEWRALGARLCVARQLIWF